MSDIRIFGLKRGYLYCIVASLTIAALSTFRYTKYLTKYHDEQDTKRLITYFVFLFSTLLIASLLLARWYYKLKAKGSERSGSS